MQKACAPVTSFLGFEGTVLMKRWHLLGLALCLGRHDEQGNVYNLMIDPTRHKIRPYEAVKQPS